MLSRNLIIILILTLILCVTNISITINGTTIEKLIDMPQFISKNIDSTYKNISKIDDTDDTDDDKDNSKISKTIDDLKSKDKKTVKDICDSVLGYSTTSDLLNTNGLLSESSSMSTTSSTLPSTPYRIPKSIIPSDIKKTNKCYKIKGGYSYDSVLIDGKPIENKEVNINMSDHINDDFDYWCKHEYGRNYGLVYIDYNNNRCKTGYGKANCSKHYYNGIRIK